jgi:protein-S-isoprenylcysteine O-methyltransferase Ste14
LQEFMPAKAIATALIALISFVAYARAIASFFVQPDIWPPAMRWTRRFGTVLALLTLFLIASMPPPGFARWAIAMMLYLSGLGLFAWAWKTTRGAALPIAFSLGVPLRIVTTGPYRFFRHPFYMSYSLTWSAGFVHTGSGILAAGAVVMVGFYIRAAIGESRALLAGPLAADYRAYTRRGIPAQHRTDAA